MRWGYEGSIEGTKIYLGSEKSMVIYSAFSTLHPSLLPHERSLDLPLPLPLLALESVLDRAKSILASTLELDRPSFLAR
jgi:hypothetical protein